MNTTGSNANAIYETFNAKGVNSSLVALFGTKAFVCLIGIIANLDILFITWRTKTLRGACNLLITSSAFSIAVQESGSFVTFAVIVTGLNFMPLGICGVVQFVPLFFTMFTTAITYFIGVDRFLSLTFPIWYLSKDKNRRYFHFVVTVCSLFALFVPIIGLRNSMTHPNKPVMCTVIDPIQPEMAWIPSMQLVVTCATVVCYLLVWALVACQTSNAIKKKQTKIFKSLTAILFGWTSNYSIRLIVVGADDLPTWYLVNIATISPYLSMTLSPFALCL